MAVLRTMAAVVVAVSCTEAALQQPPSEGRPLQQSASALVIQAHEHYKAQQWQRAAEKYEAALASAPAEFNAWFFLANSYDNLYRPARAGEPGNDGYLQKAVQHYRAAAEREADPQMRKRALEYLAAAYGPDKLNDPGMAQPIIEQMIQIDPNEVTSYLALTKIYEDAGRYDDAEETLQRALALAPQSVPVYSAMAGFYNRLGDFPKTIDALQKAADLEPHNADAHQRVAVFYWEKAAREQGVTREEKLEYILAGIAATDRAVAIRPDHVEALTYKNILLRLQANEQPDQADQLLAEADALRERAIELGKQRAVRRGVMASTGSPDAPPPPPPPDSAARPPKKVKDVAPVYPPEALLAQVQGSVIVEVSIDVRGRVADARVLQSISELDQAALDAVRQWEFEPTLVNGAPVPVTLTMTVNFSLQ